MTPANEAKGMKLDPAIIVIAAGGVVLILALTFLLTTDRPGDAADGQRKAACEAMPGHVFVYLRDSPNSGSLRGVCLRDAMR